MEDGLKTETLGPGGFPDADGEECMKIVASLSRNRNDKTSVKKKIVSGDIQVALKTFMAQIFLPAETG